MTNTKKGVNYGQASPDLVKQVKEVIDNNAKHKYSVSRVYAAYNAVFGLREQPQTCSSCLRNRARLLADWYKGYEAYAAKGATPLPVEGETYALADGTEITITEEGKALRGGKGVAAGKYQTALGATIVVSVGSKARYEPATTQYLPQADDTVRYPMAEGAPFDFLPNEGTIVKGTVTRAGGSTVEPGTYTTAEGLEIEVLEGGEANIKTEEDLT